MALRLIGTIVVPGKTESANTLNAMPLRKRLTYKKQWRNDVALAAIVAFQSASVRFAKVKRRVIITGYRKRLCDRINFASGCKPLLDGLVDAGVLVDDSETWLDDVYRQVKLQPKAVGEHLEIAVYEQRTA